MNEAPMEWQRPGLKLHQVATNASRRRDAKLHESSSFHRGLRHALTNASLLFYGPANISCVVDRCKYDAVVLTNNMFTVLPRDPCNTTRRILIVNRMFSHVLERHYANGSFASSFDDLDAILCTNKETCKRMHAKMNASHIPFFSMASPDVHGVANTLPYFMKSIRGIPFSSVHVTGVTFYETGAQYRKDYGLTSQPASRHDLASNKNYTLREIRLLGPVRASIDYPSCAPRDSDGRPTHVPSAPQRW